MTLAAIEFNDAAVALVRDGVLVARSPGYALLDGDPPTIGEGALRQARLKPRMVSTRFWERLSTELAMPTATNGWTCADLARAHIVRIWESAGIGVDGLILVVPGHFDRRQLGLLLGIAEQLSLPVRGMVDCALAACSAHSDERLVVQVAVYLHRTLVTGIDLGESARRIFAHSLEGHGLIELYERWIKMIAKVFVETTRFDPLHHADTEQAIYDRLPRWLATLAARDSLRIEMVARDGSSHAIELTRIQVEECVQEFYDALRGVIDERTSDRAFVLEIDYNAANIPGLVATLRSESDDRAVTLPPGAGALGALRRARWIVQADWQNTLTVSLPRDAIVQSETAKSSP